MIRWYFAVGQSTYKKSGEMAARLQVAKLAGHNNEECDSDLVVRYAGSLNFGFVIPSLFIRERKVFG